MFDDLQNFAYNNQLIQRRADGFVNLTQMCQANGKRLDYFFKAAKTRKYIEALKHSLQTEVVNSSVGGNHDGTWGHPTLAIRLAQWLSPEFAVWCDAHIFNLMSSGETSLDVDAITKMRLEIELKKVECEKVAIENRGVELRHLIVTTCPEPIAKAILGYQVIERVEVRDRVIHNDEMVRDGSTMTKRQLCEHYGLVTRNGTPDYKRLNAILSKVDLPDDAWKTSASLISNQEFNRDYLTALDDQVFYGDRQLFLGESIDD